MPGPLTANIFAAELVGAGLGLPLWYPEPNGREVEIGDVGFIFNNSFIRLFNVMFPSSHPANAGGVPRDFVPLQLSPDDQLKRSDFPAGPIMSPSTMLRRVSSLSLPTEYVVILHL